MKTRDALWILFISMIPLVELRVAIPIGTGLGLPFYTNIAVAIIGNLIPVPFILLFIPKILDLLSRIKIFRPIVLWLRKKALKGRGKIVREKKASEICDGSCEFGLKCATEATENCANIVTGATLTDNTAASVMPVGAFLGLLLFVLLPIPGTGAWSGSLVASLFDFPKGKSLLAIALGVIGCGIIMSLASYGVLGFLSFIL